MPSMLLKLVHEWELKAEDLKVKKRSNDEQNEYNKETKKNKSVESGASRKEK